jgi:hypothetical protein
MKFTLLRRSCSESARLITRQLDEPLPLADRLALRLHLMACKACPRFERQVKLMDQAMGRWRAYAKGDSGEP